MNVEHVTVVFNNGNVLTFMAEEFDADLAHNSSTLNRYPYKNAKGEESYIFMRPNDISGFFLTKPERGNDPSVQYKVPGT